MKRLALILAAAAAVAFSAAPADAACAADTADTCLNDPMVATITGQAWMDNNANGIRDADEHPGYQNPGFVFADYNHNGVRDTGEASVATAGNGTYTLPVDTRRLDGSALVDVRFGWSRYPVLDDQYMPTCIVVAPGCKRTEVVTAGHETAGVDFPSVGVSQVNAMVWDDKNDDGKREAGEDGADGFRFFLDDNDNGKLDAGEPVTSYRTNRNGSLTFPVPTRYQAAGGNLPPIVLEEPAGADCTAPDDCTIRGVHTVSGQMTPVEFGVARPVVIFIHGYGGSRITCDGTNQWFNLSRGGPDMFAMQFDKNCKADGLLMSVGPLDIYGGASKHFEDITWPGRHFDYVWDWRDSPATALDGLDTLIDKARKQTGNAQVEIVAHSMGGLVAREYIADPARAAKIQRIATVGTPYWGAPKTIFALTAGIEVPWFSKMDALMNNAGMKVAARSFPGHFALFPSPSYGKWLTVSGLNHDKPLDMYGTAEYFQKIGIDPMMLVHGVQEHTSKLDHYDDHGIDYQVIVGGGVPTPGTVTLTSGPFGDDTIAINWVSGDQTVPAVSGAHDTPRDRLHYVCGSTHMPLTTDPQATRLLDPFLIHGTPMHDEQSECNWTGKEVSYYVPDDLDNATASQAAGPRVISGGRTYSLNAAEAADLVQVIKLGGTTDIVSSGIPDLQIQLPAGGTATVRDISSKGAGPAARYVLTGTATVPMTGAVKGAKAVKASDKKAPVTTASLRGGKLVLKARDASRVAVTYVIVGKKKRIYTRPLRLKKAQLDRTTFGSVDIWGNAEQARPFRSR